MADLTAEQLSDLRMDLGLEVEVGGDEVFTDPELNRLWARTTDEYTSFTEAQQLVQLRLRVIRILRANTVKLYDYQLAQQIERPSQVYAHLRQLEEDFRQDLGVDTAVKIVGMTPIPPRDRTMPDGSRR